MIKCKNCDQPTNGKGYCIWAIGQFFDKGKVINYVKAFASYILIFGTFFLLLFSIELLIDLIIKQLKLY